MQKNNNDVVEVSSKQIACDGGAGALGHPMVYLDLSTKGEIDCPYCGRKFILKKKKVS